MRGLLIAAVLLALFLPQALAEVLITELLPHPEHDEHLNEWLELHNNGASPVNLSGWMIGDSADNDTLLSGSSDGSDLLLPGFGYAVLTDSNTRVYENYDISPQAKHLYVDDDSIGNGLSNNGETFFLHSPYGVESRLQYSSSQEGMSVSLINSSVVDSFPTPGAANDNTYNQGCDYKIEALMNTSHFGSPEEVGFQLRASNKWGPATSISATARLEDFFGNLIQDYKPWTNQSITSQRTSSHYTPNLDGGKSYSLAANLTTACPDAERGDNTLSEIFAVEEDQPSDSGISILNILDLGSDDKARFGQAIRARLEVYKGNTTKNSISAYVGDHSDRISKHARASITEKFSTVELTLPVQLEPNCDDEYDDGKYTLVVEGLDTSAERTLRVEGLTDDLCETILEEESETASGTITVELVELPQYVHGEEGAATLRIINGRDIQEQASVWSYFYRGSASYSGPREANRRLYTLQPNSINDIKLANTPSIEEAGSYRIRFLVQLGYRETPIVLTENIFIQKQSATQSQRVLGPGSENPQDSPSAATARVITPPKVVYESSSRRAAALAPFFLVLVLAVIVALLLIRP